MIRLFHCVILFGVVLALSRCSSTQKNLPQVLDIEEIKKERYVPAEVNRLSSLGAKAKFSSDSSSGKLNRQELAALFRSSREAEETFADFMRELEKPLSQSDLEFLFFRFSEGRAFLPYHRQQQKHLEFTKAWVAAALKMAGNDKKKQFSEYYYKVRHLGVPWRQFGLDKTQSLPGEEISLTSYQLGPHQNRPTLYTLLVEKEGKGALESFEFHSLKKFEISQRYFSHALVFSEPGKYRLTLSNPYFYQFFELTVSELLTAVKVDGELMSVMVTSLNKKISPPYRIRYMHANGHEIVAQTDAQGICHFLNDLILPESQKKFELSVEKNGHRSLVAGNWGDSYRRHRLLHVNLFTPKKLLAPEDSLFMHGILERKKEGQWIHPGVDSLQIGLINSKGLQIKKALVPVQSEGLFSFATALEADFLEGNFKVEVQSVHWRGDTAFSTLEGTQTPLEINISPVGNAGIPDWEPVSANLTGQKSASPGKGIVSYQFSQSAYKLGDTVSIRFDHPDTVSGVWVTAENEGIHLSQLTKNRAGGSQTTFLLTPAIQAGRVLTLTWFEGKSRGTSQIPIPLAPAYNPPTVSWMGDTLLQAGDALKGRVELAGSLPQGYQGYYLISLVPFAAANQAQKLAQEFQKASIPEMSKISLVRTWAPGVPDLSPEKNLAWGLENLALRDTPILSEQSNLSTPNSPADLQGGRHQFGQMGFASANEKKQYFWISPWNPLDKKGEIEINIDLPETGGSWVANVSGLTPQGRFSISKIITAYPEQELHLSVPAKISAGDRTVLRALVINNKNRPVTGTIFAQRNNLPVKIGGSASLPVTLEPGGHQVLEWPLRAFGPGQGRLALKMESDAKNLSDSVPIVISGRGQRQRVTKGGMIQSKGEPGKNYVRVELEPRRNVPGNMENVGVEMLPGLGNLLYAEIKKTQRYSKTNLDYLIHSIKTRIELQLEIPALSSRFFPEEDLPGEAARILDVLEGYEAREGGMAWIPDGPSHLHLTLLAANFCTLAKKMGGNIWEAKHEHLLQNNLAYLKNRYYDPQTTPDQKVAIIAALTQSGKRDFLPLSVKSFPKFSLLSVRSLAEIYNLAQKLKIPDVGNEAQEMIQERAVEIASEVSWNGNFKDGWERDPIETTARVLEIWAKYEPDHRYNAKAVNYLGRKYLGNGWGATKTNSQVLSAFIQYVKQSSIPKDNMVAKAFLNGKKLFQIEDISGSFSPEQTLFASTTQIQKSNQVILGFEGEGRLFYTAALNYTEKMPQSTPGFTFEKQFYRMSHQNGVEKREPSQTFFVGELVEVQWTLHPDKAYEFIEIRDPLPGAAAWAQIPEGMTLDLPGTDLSQEYALEMKEGQVVCSFQELQPGPKKIRYFLQVTHPGQFHFPAAQMESSYQPQEKLPDSKSADLVFNPKPE